MGFVREIGADIGWVVMRLSETATRARGTGYAVALGRAVGAALWWLAGVFFLGR